MSGKVARVLGAVLVLGACGGASSPGEAFCDGYCKAAERCGAPGDTCSTQCVDDRPGLSKLSVEGAQRIGDCVSGFSCSTLSDEAAWESSIQSCAESSGAAVKRTPKLRALCATYSEAWFDCDTVLSTTECEDELSLYSDEVLDSLARCTGTVTC